MKTLIVLSLLVLSGCASVSEYNQGCRDGVDSATSNNKSEIYRNGLCDLLEQVHNKRDTKDPGDGKAGGR